MVADFGYDRAGSYWTGPGRGWLAELDLPPVSREIVTDCLASIDALAPVIERLDASCTSARRPTRGPQDAQDAAPGTAVTKNSPYGSCPVSTRPPAP